MLEFCEKDIIKYFNKIKRLALKSLKKNDYEKCLKYIETAAGMAYNFNWLYTDADLEMMLSAISSKLLPGDQKYSPIKGRFVFYDYFAFDNKGLTQQYIRALISWDAEFLFLLEGDDLKHSSRIMQELKMYPKATIVALPNADTRVEKIKKAYNRIADYRPEKILMHLHPDDVVAISTLSAFPEVTKYQINLTDHAFWLGAGVTDYSLEYRNYGCTVSIEKRGIQEDRLLFQPFYPIIDCEPFKGLPPEVTPDKTIVFSGGSYYKVYDEDFTYFKVLKRILDQNPTVIILFAGSGDDKPFRKFIAEQKYEKRIFLIGNRTDINHVFSVCDIYLSTLPVIGGLMTQLAAVNGKPILAYVKANSQGDSVEDFLSYGEYCDRSVGYTNINEFISYAGRLINEKDFRLQEGIINKSKVITPQKFNDNMLELITTNKNRSAIQKIEIDYNKFCAFYIESENIHSNLPLYLARRFKLITILLFPKAAIKIALQILSDKHQFHKSFLHLFQSLRNSKK